MYTKQLSCELNHAACLYILYHEKRLVFVSCITRNQMVKVNKDYAITINVVMNLISIS